MSTDSKTRFNLLPPELIASILEELSWRDLLACKQVCRRLNGIIAGSSPLLYKIDISCAGLEDNLEHPLSRSRKRPLLNSYQKAWSRVRSLSARESNSIVSRVEDGPAWELAGGVLAQSMGTGELRFRRTPSKLRDVQESTWDVDYGFHVRDFTMDPGQDLLVALCEPQTIAGMYTLKLMRMSSSKPHPLARNPMLPLPFSEAENFEIRVNGPYVGLLAIHTLDDDMDLWSPLFVWNWKIGIKILNQIDERELVYSFAFLSDQYVVLAHMTQPPENGALRVIELPDESEDEEALPDWSDTHRCWTFLLPACQTNSSAIESMELLCDPGPGWMPNALEERSIESRPDSSGTTPGPVIHTVSQPPFFQARNDRIIVLMMTVMHAPNPGINLYTIRFSISLVQLLAYARDTSSPFTLPWVTWGPSSCRAEPQNDIWDGNWPCCVYGTRIVAQYSWVVHTDGRVRRYRPASLVPNNYGVFPQSVEICDFNQLAIRKALAGAAVVPEGQSIAEFFKSKDAVSYQDVEPLQGVDDDFEYYVHPTRLPPDFAKFFDDPDCVLTCLPYRKSHTRISTNRFDNIQLYGVEAEDPPVDVGLTSAVMLSEDAIVIVREWPEADPDFLIVSIQ